MSYRSMSIATALEQINRTLFLPAIQRPFVWKQEAIIELFDSLLRGYPISSFLFWEVAPENRRQWVIYRFQENHTQNETWNDKVEPDGRDISFVLDGQQRLTSLLIGLRGSYTTRRRPAGRGRSYRPERLYLDLFKDPDEVNDQDEVTANRFGLKFSDIVPRSDAKHLWFKLGDILDLRTPGALEAAHDRLLADLPSRVSPGAIEIAERNLKRLHELIWLDDPISYYREADQDGDRVLSIFVRANEGGTKLNKSDLLMAVIQTSLGLEMRDEITGLVKHLNTGFGAQFDFNKDLVMRACLVIPDLENVYSVNNFNAHNMGVIRDNWGRIKEALEDAVSLAARFSLDQSSLTSMNALIPIAYYLGKIRKGLDGTGPFDVVNRERIRRWLASALLNGAFGNNSDQTIGVCRDTIREGLRHSPEFPLAKLVSDMRTRRNRYLAFDDEGVRKLLDIRYGHRHCTLALGLLHDGQRSIVARYHVDHIIPRNLVTEKELRSRGVAGPKIDSIRAAVDRIGNLQLLIDHENTDKSDGELHAWLRTRDRSFLEQHLIPNDPALWHPEMLLEFIAAREELIRQRLQRFLVVEPREAIMPIAAATG